MKFRKTRQDVMQFEDSPNVSKKKGADGLTGQQRDIFQFIKNKGEQPIKLTEVSVALNLNLSSVFRAVKMLIRDGLLVEIGKNTQGRVYRVVSETAKGRTNAGSPTPGSAPARDKNTAQFVGVIETLIWEFIRVTRSTDVLAFLTWVEKHD